MNTLLRYMYRALIWFTFCFKIPNLTLIKTNKILKKEYICEIYFAQECMLRSFKMEFEAIDFNKISSSPYQQFNKYLTYFAKNTFFIVFKGIFLEAVFIYLFKYVKMQLFFSVSVFENCLTTGNYGTLLQYLFLIISISKSFFHVSRNDFCIYMSMWILNKSYFSPPQPSAKKFE